MLLLLLLVVLVGDVAEVVQLGVGLHERVRNTGGDDDRQRGRRRCRRLIFESWNRCRRHRVVVLRGAAAQRLLLAQRPDAQNEAVRGRKIVCNSNMEWMRGPFHFQFRLHSAMRVLRMRAGNAKMWVGSSFTQALSFQNYVSASGYFDPHPCGSAFRFQFVLPAFSMQVVQKMRKCG